MLNKGLKVNEIKILIQINDLFEFKHVLILTLE